MVESLAKNEEERAKYVDNYLHAIMKGLNKIMARMGISTYMSYIGAQIFEAVGLKKSFIDQYFTNTPSPVEGLDLFDVAGEAVTVHKRAFEAIERKVIPLAAGGQYMYRQGGEHHLWTPDAVVHLQRAVREGSWAEYQTYAGLINNQARDLLTIRGLFEFVPGKAIPLESVESEASIIRRFSTAAMSVGAISTEAHVTMAVAMNRMKGASNSGEGGEDVRRNAPVTTETSLKAILGDDVEVDYPCTRATACAPAFGRLLQGVSASRRTTWLTATLFRSKWLRVRSPVKAGSSRARKCRNISACSAIRCRASGWFRLRRTTTSIRSRIWLS